MQILPQSLLYMNASEISLLPGITSQIKQEKNPFNLFSMGIYRDRGAAPTQENQSLERPLDSLQTNPVVNFILTFGQILISRSKLHSPLCSYFTRGISKLLLFCLESNQRVQKLWWICEICKHIFPQIGQIHIHEKSSLAA